MSRTSGKTTAVVVPIALWREIEPDVETMHLLKSVTMKRRLLEATSVRKDPLDAVIESLVAAASSRICLVAWP